MKGIHYRITVEIEFTHPTHDMAVQSWMQGLIENAENAKYTQVHKLDVKDIVDEPLS